MKAKDVPEALESWNDVETELGILSNATVQRDKIAKQYESKISEMRSRMDQETNDLDFQVKESTSNIIRFINAHKDVEGKKRNVCNYSGG